MNWMIIFSLYLAAGESENINHTKYLKGGFIMANICMYGVEVIGEKENVAKFVEYMKGYNEQKLCGVYADEVFYMYYNNKHIVNGGCKNSVYLSMLEAEDSYYDRLTDNDKTKFTTLEYLSKALNLKFEVESDTDIAGEYEKVIVENGRLALYE